MHRRSLLLIGACIDVAMCMNDIYDALEEQSSAVLLLTSVALWGWYDSSSSALNVLLDGSWQVVEENKKTVQI